MGIYGSASWGRSLRSLFPLVYKTSKLVLLHVASRTNFCCTKILVLAPYAEPKRKHPKRVFTFWLRLQVMNSLTGVERYKSDTVCIEFDRSNNEPRRDGAMSDNERNYSAYLQNAVNSLPHTIIKKDSR